MADIRCLCTRCRSDYESAGYPAAPIYPLLSALCDKCGRPGVNVALDRVNLRRKIVFVCSPYGGDESNLKRAEEYCAREVRAGNIPFAPHLFFTRFMSEATDREKGIAFGLVFLGFCDEIHVYRTPTSGMKREIQKSISLGIKVVHMEVG